MINHPNRNRQPKTIYARRTAGDRYNVTYSYDAAMDPEVTMAYIERVARQDHATIEIDRSSHRGPGEPATETVTKFAR